MRDCSDSAVNRPLGQRLVVLRWFCCGFWGGFFTVEEVQPTSGILLPSGAMI